MTKVYRVYNKDENVYVTENHLDNRLGYDLVFLTEDTGEVIDYLTDAKTTIVMEDSVSDDICYYDYRCRVEDGDVIEFLEGE